jgi:L-seryl-tRNA(Ser) seleniumtransferase
MNELAAARLRDLPQVQRLLEAAQDHPLAAHPRPAVVASLRRALDEARAALLRGDAGPWPPARLLDRASALLEAERPAGLRRVINATGVILHTNLGRAPLAPEAAAAVAAAAGYCNLEFDLATGERGSRTAGIEPLLREITGAEAGLAVNNCAAAVLLALGALAGDGEVVVSRGELVEIGGGFRIPDVIRQGGARLVEVGTTNKTRVQDYAGAITPATRVLLKVHQSNFRMTGFTEAAALPELAALARERGLTLVHDLGSGAVGDIRTPGRPPEATARESVAAGSDVVAFSGDKLLGGPQSGLLVGRAAAIDALRRHPLLRALRLDKLTLAALEATLRLHRDGGAPPAPAMIDQASTTLRARAERLAGLLGNLAATVAATGFAGGGTLPDAGIPSFAVALPSEAAERLKAALRHCDPPVIARVADGCVLLDVLAVRDDELAELAASVRQALAG